MESLNPDTPALARGAAACWAAPNLGPAWRAGSVASRGGLVCATLLLVCATLGGCVTQVTIAKDGGDEGDTPEPTEDTPVDPDDTPTDTPEAPPAPAAVPGAAQGCAAALRASDGAYQTTGCLAPLQAAPAVAPATDGAYQLQPGALRQIQP